jgi:predicted phage baseplate assembly protein
VTDFHASRPDDRHYHLDHAEGLVTFGDGVHGRVPPAGSGNVRLRRYCTGGGTRGNLAAGTIVQLRTAIPYIERVTNIEPSSGGTDAESLDDFGERAPAVVRHRDRAVAAEDFEDLARAASGEVARAKCLPLSDLSEDASAGRPGAVSVVIVPRSTDPRPLPSTALLDRVHAYVSERQPPSVKLVVCGPQYVAIDVEADVVVAALDRVTDVDKAVGDSVRAFLDPLRGGPYGTGWEFGRRPHRSDLFSVIASIDGVDHARVVRLTPREDRPGLLETNRFLVCAGVVRMWFYTA